MDSLALSGKRGDVLTSCPWPPHPPPRADASTTQGRALRPATPDLEDRAGMLPWGSQLTLVGLSHMTGRAGDQEGLRQRCWKSALLF